MFSCTSCVHALIVPYTVGNQAIWNRNTEVHSHTLAHIRQCQVVTWCMWTGAFDSTSQNDKRFAKHLDVSVSVWVCECLIKSVNCSKSFYGVYIYVTWYVTALHIEHIGFLAGIYTACSGFIGVTLITYYTCGGMVHTLDCMCMFGVCRSCSRFSMIWSDRMHEQKHCVPLVVFHSQCCSMQKCWS